MGRRGRRDRVGGGQRAGREATARRPHRASSRRRNHLARRQSPVRCRRPTDSRPPLVVLVPRADHRRGTAGDDAPHAATRRGDTGALRRPRRPAGRLRSIGGVGRLGRRPLWTVADRPGRLAAGLRHRSPDRQGGGLEPVHGRVPAARVRLACRRRHGMGRHVARPTASRCRRSTPSGSGSCSA
jgi:hypothetical protein